MAITVKGVKVQDDEVNVETEFEFLTEEGQKRLFLENKEYFLLDALSSRYPAVRRLLWEQEILKTCSSTVLNDAIISCCFDDSKGEDDIMTLINAVGSELEERCIEFIVYAGFVGVNVKVLVAQNEKTSLKFLKGMFKLAADDFVQSHKPVLFAAIVTNPNFRVDEDIERMIADFSFENAEKIKERIKELKK